MDIRGLEIPESKDEQAKLSWHGVMSFLQEQQRQLASRENDLLKENKQLDSKCKRLEEDLQKQTQMNKELLKRIRMLEFALRQERYRSRVLHFRMRN